MSDLILDQRLTHDEVRRLTAPLALDLQSAFKVMQEELIRELEKAARAGDPPELAIERVLEGFLGEDIQEDDDAIESG